MIKQFVFSPYDFNMGYANIAETYGGQQVTVNLDPQLVQDLKWLREYRQRMELEAKAREENESVIKTFFESRAGSPFKLEGQVASQPWVTGHDGAAAFLLRRKLAEAHVRRLNAGKIELTGDAPAAFELDGEWIGHLPATFSVERQKLRVVIP